MQGLQQLGAALVASAQYDTALALLLYHNQLASLNTVDTIRLWQPL